ncbi:BppU family phage baseplate upper protein [Clostridium perfringens]|nr:BppU family phage baseplate upper protein [Clostridium perfringens]
MKEIFINVDAYNSDGIKTIQGNNNAEVYKIYVLFNKRRIDLNGKTVKMAYLRTGTVEGDVINLEVTNAQEGEITLQITNAISKKDGVYSCQLAICDAVSGFKEHTATFGLTVEANIFNKIADEIADNKDLTYIERILEEATNVSEELKSNIPVARQLNIDLENQNRILNENMDRANGVNNTLITTTEQSKVAATDAIEKKSQLESSIVEAKKFIDGLDGSQNIPQLRLDVMELQNGLKSNQALSYEGSSISANDTLEGRTEGMSIKGLTLQNLWKPISIQWEPTNKWFNALASSINFDITGKVITVKNITNKAINFQFSKLDNNYDSQVVISSGEIKVINVTSLQKFRGVIGLESVGWENTTENKNKLINGLIVCIGEHSYLPNTYFEGLKSFGEAEQEGDKYKISILSCGKNLAKLDLNNKNITPFEDGYRLDCVALYRGDEDIFDLKGKYKPNTPYVLSYYGKILDNSNANNYRIRVYYTDNTYTDGVVTGNKYEKRIIKTLSGKTVYKIIGYYGAMNGDFIVKDVMLEEGTQATQYESYKCDKKDILISAPLRSVDDVQDIMYEDGQVKVDRKLGKYTFTGDENWQILRDEKFVKTIQFYLDTSSFMNKNSHLLCNTFSFELTRINEDKEGISKIGGNGLNVWININRSKLTTQDVDGFKAWLKANPTTIVYQLATPTIEIVENCVDIDLDTYQEKTYFNILNSLQGTLDFKVPSNIGSVVQNMAKEVNNIWDVINNLLVPNIVKANGNIAMIKLNNNLK